MLYFLVNEGEGYKYTHIVCCEAFNFVVMSKIAMNRTRSTQHISGP